MTSPQTQLDNPINKGNLPIYKKKKVIVLIIIFVEEIHIYQIIVEKIKLKN